MRQSDRSFSHNLEEKKDKRREQLEQQGRTEAKQALLSEFFPQRMQQNLTQKKKHGTKFTNQLIFHNIVLNMSVFVVMCAVLVVFFP